MFDLLIKDGLIVDGSGQTGFVGDIAVINGKIAAVGDPGNSEAAKVLRRN